MTQTNTSEATDYGLTLDEADVVEYLSRHPDFFSEHPDLLAQMSVPHESGDAVSLVERQMELLREKNTDLESRLQALMSVADENNETQQQLHQLIVEVLAKTSIEEALSILQEHLSDDMQVDHVRVRLFSDDRHPLTHINKDYVLVSDSARESLDGFVPSVEPFCGRLKPSQLKRLFGEQNADGIQSCVLIPLRRGLLHGLIALGSEDEHRFNPGMDTLYIKRLGELASAALVRWITQ